MPPFLKKSAFSKEGGSERWYFENVSVQKSWYKDVDVDKDCDIMYYMYCSMQNLVTPNLNIAQRPNFISDTVLTTPQNLRMTNLFFF